MSELARLTWMLGQALLELNAAAAVVEKAKRSLRDHLGHFIGTREQHKAWLKALDARDAVNAPCKRCGRPAPGSGLSLRHDSTPASGRR